MNYKETLMWSEINQAPAVFQQVINNNKQTAQEIAKTVRQKNIKHIYAVARGTSDHALVFFKYAMEIECAIPVTLGACSIVTLYDGALDLSNSLVLGVSQSGRAADVLEIIKLANKQGATTLAVTNNTQSPLAQTASYHLYCSAGEEKSVAATKTFSAQIFALLYLVATISGKKDLLDGLENLSSELSGNFAAIDEASTYSANQYKDIKGGFILSRGITYAIALEAALKLQETSYITMKGYATSDFFHGPMAMVGDKTPIFIFAAEYKFDNAALKQNHFEDQVKGIDKMLSLNADVLIITDDQKLLDYYKGKANGALVPPSANEYFSMFKFAIFAQMLSCKISCGIGNNPDSPRALNKVTVTK